MSNLQTIQNIYEAFGRGDIPAILSRLQEDVEWDYGLVDAGVPWLKPRKGIDKVTKFFESMSAFELRKFQPKTFFENGNTVVALIDVDLVVKATNQSIHEEDEVHIWQFNDQGKITRFTHKVDSHQHWKAFYGK